MKSIQRRFNNFQYKNQNVGDYVNLARTVKDQKFSKNSISRWFEKLVNKDDYERKDKRWLIKHLVKVSNPLRTTIFDTRLPLGSTKMAITYSDSL